MMAILRIETVGTTIDESINLIKDNLKQLK